MASPKDHQEPAPDKHAQHAASPPCECNGLDQGVREAGQRILDGTKGLREEIARQAQARPLVTVAAAFAAGILIARALRR